MCLAYLMFSRHLRLDDAFDYVRARRNVISPNANFMMQLSQFETELRKLGVCWPEAWSQRYPSSSSSTTTDEDMSSEDSKNRLESSSSTTSSEFSWQGTSRGNADTAVGHQCLDSSLHIPPGRDQYHHHQEPASCCQNPSSPRKSTITDPITSTISDGSFQNKFNITYSEKLNSNTHLQLNFYNCEDVFFQQPPDSQFTVRHQALSPNCTNNQNLTSQSVQQFEPDIKCSLLSPPPKSPSLNFGCLHEQAKTSSQNFFFGSCPDITGVNLSQATGPNLSVGICNANERNFDNDVNSDVFPNGLQEVAKQRVLSDEDEESSFA